MRARRRPHSQHANGWMAKHSRRANSRDHRCHHANRRYQAAERRHALRLRRRRGWHPLLHHRWTAGGPERLDLKTVPEVHLPAPLRHSGQGWHRRQAQMRLLVHQTEDLRISDAARTSPRHGSCVRSDPPDHRIRGEWHATRAGQIARLQVKPSALANARRWTSAAGQHARSRRALHSEAPPSEHD